MRMQNLSEWTGGRAFCKMDFFSCSELTAEILRFAQNDKSRGDCASLLIARAGTACRALLKTTRAD